MNTQTNKIKESEVKELSKEYQLVLDNYKNFLKTRNLRNKSIVSYIDNTKPFLLFLNDNKIKISNMTKNDVYKYEVTEKVAKKNIIIVIIGFFRFF